MAKVRPRAVMTSRGVAALPGKAREFAVLAYGDLGLRRFADLIDRTGS